jgi:radial spoke head protein 4A
LILQFCFKQEKIENSSGELRDGLDYVQAAEDEGGGQIVTPAEDFVMPPAEELAALEAWVHKNATIPKQGRCTKFEEVEEGEEGGEEDEEAADGEEGAEGEEEEEEPEEEPGPLRAISEDKDLVPAVGEGEEGGGGAAIKAWSFCKSSSIKNLKHQVVCLRSHLWPGAYCVATPTSFSNIYVGYGVKNEPFKPTMPPPVQKEYAGELIEATDLPPKPDPPPEEGSEGSEGEEEGEDEEEY